MILQKHSRGILTAALWVLCSVFVLAQLSPGKLAQGHSQLEGLSNCTQCHNIGAKIAEQKCLACHKELNARVSAKKGYHASSAVKGKECISCHSDHHGLKFDMIRFDQKTFDHKLTGYELKGGHKISDCKKCHQADHIASPTLKKKPDTFLGFGHKNVLAAMKIITRRACLLTALPATISTSLNLLLYLTTAKPNSHWLGLTKQLIVRRVTK